MISEKSSVETDDSIDPSEGVLIVVLEQNWLHARHAEAERFLIMNFYLLLISATFGYIVDTNFSKNFYTYNIVLLLGIILVISICMFLNTIKLSSEFKNHIRAVQWTSEKLHLIKHVNPETNSDNIAYKGSMALPLPLPIKVNKLFFFIFSNFFDWVRIISIYFKFFNYIRHIK